VSTSLNTVPAVSFAQQPRALVKARGTVITGLLDFSTTETDFFHPSTFRCSFSLAGLPAANDAKWWAHQPPDIEIELFAGFPKDPESFTSADLDSIFVGRADEAVIDWVGGTLELNGRDLSAKFADLKSSKKYPNLTASQIATQLAGEAGLTPVVKATTTKTGKYYEIDKVNLQDDRTQWDLLTWLAREEQFVVFVRGRELRFQPKPDTGSTPWLLQYTPPANGGPPILNATALKTTRELTIAKDIKVTVRSWNAKHKKAFVVTATRSKKGNAGTVQNYDYTIAGLTNEQAQARANQILAELSQHECKLSFEGPADNLLHVDNVIKLTGTGADADQVYFPASIERTMSPSEGYRWTVEAKNHSTASEPSL